MNCCQEKTSECSILLRYAYAPREESLSILPLNHVELITPVHGRCYGVPGVFGYYMLLAIRFNGNIFALTKPPLLSQLLNLLALRNMKSEIQMLKCQNYFFSFGFWTSSFAIA